MSQSESAVDQKITGFARVVLIWHLAFAPLLMCLCSLPLHRLCWGIPLGLAIGFASFSVLVLTVQRLQGSNSRILGISLALTTLKFAALFGLIAALWHFQVVDLLELLGGLLASQFAISGASWWASRGIAPAAVIPPAAPQTNHARA